MYRAIAANKRNTVLIIGLFVGLLTALALWWGQATGNGSSAIFIVLFVLGYTIFQYYASSSIAIAMSGAHQIEKKDNPRLWNIVENLSITEGLPMPKVYIINDPAPNAFATGRNPKNAVVAATTGLLEIMDDNELQGVMAHELGHVKNYDIRVSTIVFGLVSAIGILADMAIRMAWFGSGARSRDHGQLAIFLIAIGIEAWRVWATNAPSQHCDGAHVHQRSTEAWNGGASFFHSPPNSRSNQATFRNIKGLLVARLSLIL